MCVYSPIQKEVEMLNQAHIEGYTTKKQWTYSGDRFFRLAVYRDPDRPRKESNRKTTDERDQPDYVTVRLPAALLAGLPVQFDPGQRVQVHGWLESREFEYRLDEYLDDAQGPKPEVEPAQAGKVVAHRATTWITADRIVVVPNNRGK
jgi:hypothetical protein